MIRFSFNNKFDGYKKNENQNSQTVGWLLNFKLIT